MKAHDAGLDAEIIPVVGAQPLDDQLFPAIGILGQGRIGVFLFERCDVGTFLQILGVDTGRGREQVTLDAVNASRFQRVDVDEVELNSGYLMSTPRTQYPCFFRYVTR